MLFDGTNSGKLQWKEGADDSVIVDLDGSSIRVRERQPPGWIASLLKSENGPDQPEVEVQLLNEKGLVIDVFSARIGEGAFTALSEVFRTARYRARGGDQKLTEIEAALRLRVTGAVALPKLRPPPGSTEKA